jgi:8-oxo-dGTP diphosphatase
VKRIAACILFDENFYVLLQLRDNFPSIRSSGLWSLPGGEIEVHESSVEAVKREIKEETNLVLRSPRFLLTLVDSFESGPPVLVDIYVEKVTSTVNVICGEGQRLEFVSVDEIGNYPSNFYLDFVLRYARSVIQSFG